MILAVIGVVRLLQAARASPTRRRRRAADQTTITIEGHQFYWLFRYPNGAVSIDQMVAPADQVVNEDVKGYDYDVNHSWWVPDLGGKYDAIPGTTNHTWFKAPAGTYVARCAELCGIQHALMDGTRATSCRARSTTRSSRSAPRTRPARRSARRSGPGVCQKCHRLDHAYIGPALGGNPLLADRKGIETLLRNGQGQMPAVGKNWTGAQIDALDRLHEAVREGRRRSSGRQRRDRPPVPRRLAPRQGHVVADDRRPQAHRDPLHLDVARRSSRSAACSRC